MSAFAPVDAWMEVRGRMIPVVNIEERDETSMVHD
jgi:hypothetical protein